MDLVEYSESSSEEERDNDLSLLGNLSRHPSYFIHTPESVSNESNHSVSQSLVRELSFVKGRLEEERDKLKEWEGELQQREARLLGLEKTAWEAHRNLSNIADTEVAKRWNELEEDHGKALSELRGNLKEKGQENHRLKNSFNYVREGNDVLRQQMANLKIKNDKLEKEIASLQGRVTSLKRLKVDPLQSTSSLQLQVSEPCLVREDSSKSVTSREVKKKVSFHSPQTQAYTDSLFITLSWLTDSILSPSQPPEHSKLSLRVTRLLSSLSEVMRYFSSLSCNHELVLVRFFYWSLYHYRREQDASISTHITATLRRIGEECFSSVQGVYKGNNSTKRKSSESQNLFLCSPNLEVRVLSSMIALQTLSQADTCSHAYDLFRNELREVKAREIVLAYRIVDILLAHFTSQNRLLLTNSILTLLLLVVEQTQSSLQFSLSLCSDHFFRTTSHLLIEERLDESIKEKLAVILQRLSKLPHSLKLFERSGLEHCCEELLRRLEPSQAFLKLNLESVLANNALARHNS